MSYPLAGVLPILMDRVDRDEPAPATAGDPADVRALIASAQSGDQAAFGTLVSMHERIVFRTALAALGSREDAEDAAQEAFVMAWRRLSGFRGDSTFKTWLLTITWRKALDRRRSRRVWWSRQITSSSSSSSWAEDHSSPLDVAETSEPTPERVAVSKDLADRAKDEITRLSPKLRDALLLAASGEHRYEEIATLLGIPIGTVKWRVSEARRLLTLRLDAQS
ncbi:MAG: RNA polymerase sigma factor [Acidobacteria bacterium]|nr:MAG: RNA polymerase sigma factor [Acidobacteriota bacterium]